MKIAEYAGYDATGLAELIGARQVSRGEVYAAAVTAIDAVNIDINAIADGPWNLPLEHVQDATFGGVPFVFKDLGVQIKDVPIRSGTRLSGTGEVAAADSFLVRRFREAGLAPAALTTTPAFGFNASTEALIYGPTRNPWDTSRSVGGSSGGTAALVAAGGVPVGHGGDGGGSIRLPASANGIVGLKPSRGRTSVGPAAHESFSGLGIDFALTRTIRDCAALLDAVAGTMPGDPFSIREPDRPWRDELSADPGGLRIALCVDSFSDASVDPEVAACVLRVAESLQELGHHVDLGHPRLDWDQFIQHMTTLEAVSLASQVQALSEATGVPVSAETLERALGPLYERGCRLTAVEMMGALSAVNDVSRTVGAFFTEWDLLLTPTMNTPPLRLGYYDADDPSYDPEAWTRHIFGTCSFTPFANWSGVPAISLPLGWTADELPVGVQLVGGMCDEATIISVSSQLEQAMPWAGRVPKVHATTTSCAADARTPVVPPQ